MLGPFSSEPDCLIYMAFLLMDGGGLRCYDDGAVAPARLDKLLK